MKMKTKKPKEQTKDPKPPGHWSLKTRAAVQPKKESAMPLPPEEGVEDSKGQRSPGSSTSCRIPTPTLASLATSAHKRKATGETERQREEREVTISIHQLQN